MNFEHMDSFYIFRRKPRVSALGQVSIDHLVSGLLRSWFTVKDQDSGPRNEVFLREHSLSLICVKDSRTFEATIRYSNVSLLMVWVRVYK